VASVGRSKLWRKAELAERIASGDLNHHPTAPLKRRKFCPSTVKTPEMARKPDKKKIFLGPRDEL
jgi:hypothetical protein